MEHVYKKVLNAIVAAEGNCLTEHLCSSCPFRRKCLPGFLEKETRFSKRERYEMAADMLARMELMLDEN